MKRVWAALVLFAAAIALCAAGWGQTVRHTNRVCAVLSQAQACAARADAAGARAQSEQALAAWQRAHDVLCTFLPHARLESVSQTLAALPALAQSGGLGQFSGECARGISQLQALQQEEAPHLQNIL